jgi:predicted transcriptional regulator
MTALKTELNVQDVMTAEPVCVDSSTTIRELARVFKANEISGAPVVDQGGTLIGVVSKTDLVRRALEGPYDMPPAYLFEVLFEQGAEDSAEGTEVIHEPLAYVQDFMTQDPVTVRPDTPVAEIARLMFDHRIHRIIVVDEQNFPVGIITSLDMLGVFWH